MRCVKVVILVLFVASAVSAAGFNVNVIASGDMHGMVQSCDCNIEPGGGLAKRSYFLNALGGRGNMLLLDAGGFSAGGLYDTYTEGREADSIRSEQAIAGLGLLHYDAIGVGDDDLQYGADWLLQRAKAASLPLISANCFSENGSLLFTPYVVINKSGKRIAITSVVTQEKLFEGDQKTIVADPLKSLKKIWNELNAKSDYQIVLSHLGSSKTRELLDSLPEFDLAVNGHRKTETNALSMVNNVPVLQFGFQGKSLSYALIAEKNKKLIVDKSGWYIIGNDLPDDRKVVGVIDALKKGKQTDVYDLYMMSQCPYGLEALPGFVAFIEKNQDVNWNIWFIGSVENDTILSSLHGPGEVRDEMMWLAVKNLYPTRWFEFIKAIADSSKTTEITLKKMGISQAEIDKWIASNGVSQLTGHYLRSDRVNIKASPTLLINNSPYEKQLTLDRLLKNRCEGGEKKKYCDSLPECVDNSDCKQKGKLGKCENKKCVFADAVKFTFTVVVPDSARQKPEDMVITTTEDLFAGVTIEKVTMSSQKGNELINRYQPDALPFYLFAKDVKQAYNFEQIEKGLIEKKDGLFFKKGIVRSNFFFRRAEEKGKIVLFIDPFFKDISGILNALQKDTSFYNKVTVLPMFYDDPQKDLWGTEEGFRHEEALRWLTMDKFFGDKAKKYLTEYSKSPGSSYWFRILDGISIPSDTFITTLRANSDALMEHWKLLLQLSIREPVVVLFDNRETAIAGSRSAFEALVGKGMMVESSSQNPESRSK
jgi:hypothetical protein